MLSVGGHRSATDFGGPRLSPALNTLLKEGLSYIFNFYIKNYFEMIFIIKNYFEIEKCNGKMNVKRTLIIEDKMLKIKFSMKVART